MESSPSSHSEVPAIPSDAAQAPVFIEARSVARSYQMGKVKVPVLHGVDLQVLAGESIFLCGPSGAGKTTLLYILAGLERPDSGEVLLEGESLYAAASRHRAKQRNQRMGYLFQHFFLMPELTALENVLLPAMIGGKDRTSAARALLEKVGLGHRMEHLPAELSGGEQQRVALARALINNPPILFADEPTGNLDTKTGSGIIELMLGLARDEGKTLVIVTHDSALAARGDRVLQLRDGQVV